MNAPVVTKRMIYVAVAIVVLLPFVGLAALRAMSARPKNLGVADGRLDPAGHFLPVTTWDPSLWPSHIHPPRARRPQ